MEVPGCEVPRGCLDGCLDDLSGIDGGGPLPSKPPSVASDDATRRKRLVPCARARARVLARAPPSLVSACCARNTRPLTRVCPCAIAAAKTRSPTRATSPARRAATTTWTRPTRAAARRAPRAQHGKGRSARTRRQNPTTRQTTTTSSGSAWSAPKSSRDRKSLCASGTGLTSRAHTQTHMHARARARAHTHTLIHASEAAHAAL